MIPWHGFGSPVTMIRGRYSTFRPRPWAIFVRIATLAGVSVLDVAWT
jgi:hypothetical protein